MKKSSLSLFCLATIFSQAHSAENNPWNLFKKKAPEPEKSADCECYPLPFYDLECDWGVFLTADFLYWYARETNLAYAMKLQTEFIDVMQIAPKENFFLAPKSYKHIDTEWEPGFRIGIGRNYKCDGWDVFAHWTYFHSKESSSTSVPEFNTLLTDEIIVPSLGEFALINPWINSGFEGRTFELLCDRISAKWRLNFNSIDLEIGRKYWLSDCFNLRPFAGVRGAWTKTTFRTKTSVTHSVNNLPANKTLIDQFIDRYWGAGLVLGLQPNWYFSNNFIFFGNLDASLIWGEFEAKKKERYRLSGIVASTNLFSSSFSNAAESEFFMMQAILDLAVGLRLEDTWCCDRYRIAFDVGWEHHIWFDHNHRIKTLGVDRAEGEVQSEMQAFRGPKTFAEATGNLMFGGLVIRLRFDF